jgi:hypothetical protein
MTDAVMTADAHLFDVRPATPGPPTSCRRVALGARTHFRGQNPQGGASINYYPKSVPSGDVKITITDRAGRFVRDDGHSGKSG